HRIQYLRLLAICGGRLPRQLHHRIVVQLADVDVLPATASTAPALGNVLLSVGLCVSAVVVSFLAATRPSGCPAHDARSGASALWTPKRERHRLPRYTCTNLAGTRLARISHS